MGWAAKKDLDIRLDGKKLNQRDSFVYLGEMVCRDGSTEMETRRRVQAGASVWRKVEEVMGDRHIYRKLKGKVLSSCITPTCPRDLGDDKKTTISTASLQEELQE